MPSLWALIDCEATAVIGAASHERTETRTTQRSGSRPKTLTTTAGDVTVAIPKTRTGSLFPSLLEPRRRIDRALHAVISEAYVRARPVHREVDDVVVAMGGRAGVSKSEVSRICALLDAEVRAFADRPLTGAFAYLFGCDVVQGPGGRSGGLPGRRRGHRGVPRRPREVLGHRVGDSEAEAERHHMWGLMLPARIATYDWSAVTPNIKNERRQELWKAVVGGRPLDDLVGGVLDALDISPLAYGISVFGLPSSWVPWRRYSEFGLVYPWRPLRAATYAADVVIPSLPLNAPPWVPSQLGWAFWHPTLIGQRPDHNDNPTTSPEEAWFLINGILTNDSVAQLNAAYLTYLFHRPITLIQNSTGGIGEDLLECALDKAMFRTGEAATKAFTPIYDALKDRNKTRVVVVAHSQGTIIAGVLLRFLQQLRAIAAELPPRFAPPEPVYPDDIPLDPDDFDAPTDSEIAKLEVYCFANCTTRMEYLVPAAHTPWIESYGNEFDIVARLGVLAPHPEQHGVKIDGPRYVHPGAWGHFLNAHYLYDVEREQKRGRKRGPKQRKATPFVLVNASDYPGAEVPRLYRYLNGGSPSDPPWAISSVRQSDRASARPDIPPPRTASEKPGSAGREGSGRPVTAGSCPGGATDAFDPSALDSYAGLRGDQGAGEDSSHSGE